MRGQPRVGWTHGDIKKTHVHDCYHKIHGHFIGSTRISLACKQLFLGVYIIQIDQKNILKDILEPLKIGRLGTQLQLFNDLVYSL